MLRDRFKSFGYAFKGIALLFREETNARIHGAFTFAVIVAGWYFKVNATEWCLLILSISLVLMAEAFNTAIENLTDLASPENHPLAGKAKDVAAGGVLLSAIGAAVVGGIIFLPKLLSIL